MTDTTQPKHTPAGERWKADGLTIRLVTNESLRDYVAEVNPLPFYYPDGLKLAQERAHLIAAAPDLLEAAEELLLVIGDVCKIEPQRRKLIAAIAKAKGEGQ